MSDFPYRKLGELCTILSSKRIFAKEYIESGVPFYRSKEIIQKHNGESINTELFISEERFSEIESKYGVPKENDMLMTSVGTLGVAYVVSCKDRFYFKDGNLTWYKDFSPELNSKYLFYLFDSELGKDLIKSVTIGSSQAALTIDGMKNLEVPCPDICIQEKIVKLLKTYDDLIENNNRRIAILEEMAQKLYREWFVHFRFPGHENVKMVESELGLIPEGWTVSTIYDEAHILGGGTPSKSNPAFWQGGDIPLFSPRDAIGQTYVENTGMHITESGLEKCNSGLYHRNTIVITARGTVGKIVLAAEDMAINQSCYALQSKGISQFYLLHMLRGAVEELKKVATGTAFDSIITETFKNIKCLVPAKSVCLEFEHLLTNIYDAILVLQQKNTNLRKTRDLLLPRLISGDIDVSELDIAIKEG